MQKNAETDGKNISFRIGIIPTGSEK